MFLGSVCLAVAVDVTRSCDGCRVSEWWTTLRESDGEGDGEGESKGGVYERQWITCRFSLVFVLLQRPVSKFETL